jgi:hypothetical protein
MDDSARKYTRQEMLAYGPQPCPVCGQRTMTYRFVDASSLTETYWLRGTGGCSNRSCALNGGDQGEMP